MVGTGKWLWNHLVIAEKCPSCRGRNTFRLQKGSEEVFNRRNNFQRFENGSKITKRTITTEYWRGIVACKKCGHKKIEEWTKSYSDSSLF